MTGFHVPTGLRIFPTDWLLLFKDWIELSDCLYGKNITVLPELSLVPELSVVPEFSVSFEFPIVSGPKQK